MGLNALFNIFQQIDDQFYKRILQNSSCDFYIEAV